MPPTTTTPPVVTSPVITPPVVVPPIVVPPVVAPAVMIFKNGFEGTTTIDWKPSSPIQHKLIRGNEGVAKSDWYEDLEQNPYIGFGQFYMETGTPAQRDATIVADPDPAHPTNKVLRFRITEKHILISGTGEEKARIQYELKNNKVAPKGGYLTEWYQKCRMYLSPSFQVLLDAPTDKIGWFVLQEFRNDPSWDAPLAGGSFKPRSEQRNEVEIEKINGQLYMGAKAKYPIMQNPPEFAVFPTAFPLPLGKWITQEIYMKEGNNQTGRFYLALTVDGVKHVIIDQPMMTMSLATGYVPDGFTSPGPLKVYTEGKVLDWFKAKNLPMDVYWDDLEIWFNKRP